MKKICIVICVLLLAIGCNSNDSTISAPTNMQVNSVTQVDVNISWEDQSDNESSFEIERAIQGEEFKLRHKSDAGAESFIDEDIDQDVIYTYRVRAVNSEKKSEYSNIASTESYAKPSSQAIPNRPESLQTPEVSATTLVLTWVDRSNNESGFEIERSEQDDFTDAVTLVADINETRFVDSGLTPETTYYYRIHAYNSVGDSTFTEPISVTLLSESEADTEVGRQAVGNLIADYTVSKESVLRRIPQWAINAAKENLKIMYCGTSHSTQVVDGMRGLMEYKDGDSSLFNFTYDGTATSGALSIDYRPDSVYPAAQDLSHDSVDSDGHTEYFRKTVDYLDATPDCNVVMWSWCRIRNHNTDIYLNNFSELIDMYRAGGSKGRSEQNAVTFVFMSGFASGHGDAPEPPYTMSAYQNHKRIVDFCEANGYFCLDYWSHDTYNYGDDSYKPTEDGNNNAQHLSWVNNPENELGVDWFECRRYDNGEVALPSHANQHLTGNRRAYAAWWIFARIAGWDGTLE